MQFRHISIALLKEAKLEGRIYLLGGVAPLRIASYAFAIAWFRVGEFEVGGMPYMYERVKSSTFGISHVIRQNVKCLSFTRVGSSLF